MPNLSTSEVVLIFSFQLAFYFMPVNWWKTKQKWEGQPRFCITKEGMLHPCFYEEDLGRDNTEVVLSSGREAK